MNDDIDRWNQEFVRQLHRYVSVQYAYNRAHPLPPGPLPPQEHWHELAARAIDNAAYTVVRAMMSELRGTEDE